MRKVEIQSEIGTTEQRNPSCPTKPELLSPVPKTNNTG